MWSLKKLSNSSVKVQLLEFLKALPFSWQDNLCPQLLIYETMLNRLLKWNSVLVKVKILFKPMCLFTFVFFGKRLVCYHKRLWALPLLPTRHISSNNRSYVTLSCNGQFIVSKTLDSGIVTIGPLDLWCPKNSFRRSWQNLSDKTNSSPLQIRNLVACISE